MDLTLYKNCLAHTNGVYISNEIAPYKPCCWFKTGIAAATSTEYKQKLAALDIEFNCSHCIKQEAAGSTWSHRQLFNKPREFVLGVCFDNICNLKCVTCSPTHTSRLIQDWEDLGKFYGDYDKRYFTRLSKQAPSKLDFIKETLSTATFDELRLEIFGGEPLINPTVFEFIDWLAAQPYAQNTVLSITTNGTTFTDRIEGYISRFRYVGIQLSIDGVADSFEYLRYGADFAATQVVIDQYYALLAQYPNQYSLSFNYTLSWMNSIHFEQFYNWAAENYPLIHLHLTKVEGPAEYSVEVIPAAARNAIVSNNLSKCVNIPSDQFKKLLQLYTESMTFTHGNADEIKFNKALAALNTLDARRGNDHATTFKNTIEMINDSFR
jgi:sulfatase maturation enzyme AslB (radical SAM superfamily)